MQQRIWLLALSAITAINIAVAWKANNLNQNAIALNNRTVEMAAKAVQDAAVAKAREAGFLTSVREAYEAMHRDCTCKK